jgi:hypothetical protein
LAMHRLTFDPGQRRVLLLVSYKTFLSQFVTRLTAISLQK